MKSCLAEALHIDPDAAHSTLDFARVVHNAPEWIRASPVFAMEGFQATNPDSKLFTLTSGQIVHQFIMITVHLRGPLHGQWQWTYLKIDFSDQPFPEGSQLVTLADDHEGLRYNDQSRGLGRVAGKDRPVENGPSLEDIASLLEAIHTRTLGGYNCFGRNCLWLTENLLLATARRHSDHWLSGHCHPESLRRYLRGECDAITCISGMTYGNPVVQAVVNVGMRAWRNAAILVTHSGSKQIETHEEDVRLILEEWQTRPHTQAALIYE